MKRIGLLFTFLMAAFAAFSQQRPIQSLYMFDPLVLNPAYAGTHVQLSATAVYRNQWVNLEGAPRTFTSSIHSGFKKARVGLGILFGNDQIGVHSENSLYMMYAYKIPLSNRKNPAVLSMGIQGGFNNLRSDYFKTFPRQGDEIGAVSKFNPNFGAGVFYRSKELWAGLSCPYILNNTTVGDIQNELTDYFSGQGVQERYYYLIGGTTRKLSEKVKISPSTLIRIQENAPLSFDFNTMVILHDIVSIGGSYRIKDAVIGMFELKINDNFHVGYAYDITTSALRNHSNGSHELMINYRIKFARIHRGLECPSYW
jgi:type IX secretion system PorP/SprF family membrane protein